MPRKHLIKTAEFPYQITNRSNNKEFFYLDLDKLWDIFIQVLHKLETDYAVRIHLFVLMSNHYHLIVDTPKENIGEAMKYFHREIARAANKKTFRINHFFGTRYKWCIIDNEKYYWNAVKYNFRNPVAAGICNCVEDYKYSSLNSPSKKVNWHVVDFFHSPTSRIALDLEWLNEGFTKEQAHGISKALRRRRFEISANESKKIISLGTPQYEKETVT